jgi:hypothetical protein
VQGTFKAEMQEHNCEIALSFGVTAERLLDARQQFADKIADGLANHC